MSRFFKYGLDVQKVFYHNLIRLLALEIGGC